MSGNEFAINSYLTLKLEGNATVIYVGGKRFRQCKYLLLSVPVSDIESLKEVQSMDEAAESLDHSLETHQNDNDNALQKPLIPPEVEFWGHCSNLQAWAEHDYDTRLLHSSIAFQLLKALVEEGDPVAQARFKEEIARRFTAGPENVREILWFEGYLSYLTKEEFCSLFEEEGEIIWEIKEELNLHEGNFKFEGTKLYYLSLHGKKLTVVPEKVRKLSNLTELRLGTNLLETLPDWIGAFKSLKKLDLAQNRLTKLPTSIGRLEALESLKLFQTPLKELPDEIGNLKSLKFLDLQEDAIERLPKPIGNLSSLENLVLWKNKLKELPDEIGNLRSLTHLNLSNNELTTLPESIGNLKSLQGLNVNSNKLSFLPKSIGNLKSLGALSVSWNELESLPDSIGNLSSLEDLSLVHNNLRYLPSVMQNLSALEDLNIRNNPITELPKWIFKLPKLHFLNFEGTWINVTENLKRKCKEHGITIWVNGTQLSSF